MAGYSIIETRPPLFAEYLGKGRAILKPLLLGCAFSVRTEGKQWKYHDY
jgi:hypothetical protein